VVRNRNSVSEMEKGRFPGLPPSSIEYMNRSITEPGRVCTDAAASILSIKLWSRIGAAFPDNSRDILRGIRSVEQTRRINRSGTRRTCGRR